MTAIQIDHLHKTFSDGNTSISVLEDISLQISAGEFVTIAGRSGCGKSTLLRIICGLETATSGSVLRNGVPVTGPSTDCSMVFQDHRLLPWLTVRKNVSFGLTRASREEKRQLEDNYLHLVGLDAFADCYPAQLSGGMAQRAAIARGLVTAPKILLLDEPFAALDALTRIQMQQEIRRLQRDSGITMVMVTHDIEEAVYLGDRVLVMSARPGRVQRLFDLPAEVHENRGSSSFAACKEQILQEIFAQEDAPL